MVLYIRTAALNVEKLLQRAHAYRCWRRRHTGDACRDQQAPQQGELRGLRQQRLAVAEPSDDGKRHVPPIAYWFHGGLTRFAGNGGLTPPAPVSVNREHPDAIATLDDDVGRRALVVLQGPVRPMRLRVAEPGRQPRRRGVDKRSSLLLGIPKVAVSHGNARERLCVFQRLAELGTERRRDRSSISRPDAPFTTSTRPTRTGRSTVMPSTGTRTHSGSKGDTFFRS